MLWFIIHSEICDNGSVLSELTLLLFTFKNLLITSSLLLLTCLPTSNFIYHFGLGLASLEDVLA